MLKKFKISIIKSTKYIIVKSFKEKIVTTINAIITYELLTSEIVYVK